MCSRLEASSTALKKTSEHPFRSAMSDFTNVPPKKLAFYLFSKGVIKEEDYEQTKQLVTDPNSDPEEINMDNLMKAYDVLQNSPMKIGDICSALEKLHKEIAQKLAADSELCKSFCTSVATLIWQCCQQENVQLAKSHSNNIITMNTDEKNIKIKHSRSVSDGSSASIVSKENCFNVSSYDYNNIITLNLQLGGSFASAQEHFSDHESEITNTGE